MDICKQLRIGPAHQSKEFLPNDPWRAVGLDEVNGWTEKKPPRTVATTELPNRLMPRSKTDILFDFDSAEMDGYEGKSCDTLSTRRTSLHGKTITVRISRNETKYRKLQAQVYNFLERPKTWRSFTYHGLV
ncbi:hypothetical protein CLF_106314 [Clonorchis sinensis]|uniref:Uncharacterized protein n=1 Tax=Clonorchis sinensis TaxID=79923 RepID=G7YPW4_CLOSI|nr:hypothetical protein CLF_106314 [Clonorchis sinensis]